MESKWKLVVNGIVVGEFSTENAAWQYGAAYYIGEQHVKSIKVVRKHELLKQYLGNLI